MKVLVLGRQGQLARALAETGALAGHDIDCAGRAACDIRDMASVQTTVATASADVVVNTAAYTAVDRAESEAADAFAVNATGAANVARACEGVGVPLIHVSTDYVFDGSKPAPYRENDSTAPLNVYGHSKLEGEKQVMRACARHVVLRTSWLYSQWGSNFVETMLRLAAVRDAIDVVDDQRGCPTYAPHLAEGIIGIAEGIAAGSKRDPFGIYHVAGQGMATWYGFAEEIFLNVAKQGSGAPSLRKIAAAQYPRPARRPANSRLDCSKLQHVFGIRLPNWQTGVEDCVARLLTRHGTAGETSG